MKSFDRPRFIALALLPLALTLGGCSLIPSGPGIPNIPGLPDGGDEGLEEFVEGATGGDVDFEAGSLPADFPVDDIPLVPGEIVVGMVVGATDGQRAWQVSIKVADESVAQSAEVLLTDAGFSYEGIAFEDESYQVVVTPVNTSEGWQVIYTVSEL